MWKNMVDKEWVHITIKQGACALHAGKLRIQTHTLRISKNYCFSTATMVAEHDSMLRYTTLSVFSTLPLNSKFLSESALILKNVFIENKKSL